MGRCKSCNRKMLEHELRNTLPDGSIEDLCNICKPTVNDLFTYSSDHTHQFENLQEGLLDYEATEE